MVPHASLNCNTSFSIAHSEESCSGLHTIVLLSESPIWIFLVDGHVPVLLSSIFKSFVIDEWFTGFDVWALNWLPGFAPLIKP